MMPPTMGIRGAINNESFDDFVSRIFDMCTRGKEHWLREDLLAFLKNNAEYSQFLKWPAEVGQ